jgi:hypothetical protein
MSVDFEERARPAKNEEKELAEFERRLQVAIRRHEAPLGLKSRVLAQARARRQARHGRGWIFQRIAASALLAGLFGGYAVYHEQQQRQIEQRKGEQAAQQLMTALRITSRTLSKVNEHLAENAR